MTPKPHQLQKAELAWQIMLKYRYVYVQGEPRSGKTLTALLIAEKSKRIENVIIFTTKKALPGWEKFITNEKLKATYLTKNYTLINYEQLGSYKLRTHSKKGVLLKHPIQEPHFKLDRNNFQLAIIDESHKLGKIGKPSQRYKLIQQFCQDLPHIHLSGTAYVESPNSIYYQMHISKYSPFEGLNSFYDYFRVFGQPSLVRIGETEVPSYVKAHPSLLPYIEQFTVRITQDEAGISKDVQSKDTIHYISLLPATRQQYNQFQKDRIITINNNLIVGDSTMKLRTSLHMFEGGTMKIGNTYLPTGNLEKVNFIKNLWGDHPKLGIMAHFIGEQQLLKEHFQYAEIYSSTSHAEGVDLSHLDDFVIYSSGYSGSKFIQRNERTVNSEQSSIRVVHHLIVKGAISEQVFSTCSQKQNFNNKTYQKTYLKD